MPIIVCAVAMISWVPRLTTPIDLRNDASVYFILGTALSAGQGYRLLNEPGNIEATQYPPLLPLVVAGHQWLLGTSDPIRVGQWLRLTFFVVYVLSGLATYVLLTRHLPLRYAFFATLICLLSVYNYLMSNLLVPELLFGLATILFFLCHERSHRRHHFALAYVAAVAAYGLRSIGVALFAAWVAEALLQKDFKQMAVRLALSLIPVLGWQGYIHHVESSVDYQQPAYAYQRADYLFYNVSYGRNILMENPFRPELGRATVTGMASRFLTNLRTMAAHIGEVVTVEKKLWFLPFGSGHPWMASMAVDSILTLLGCMIVGGLVAQLLARQWIIPIYVLFTTAAICLTPWPVQLVRYLTPLCPFLALSLCLSLRHLPSALTRVLRGAAKPAGAACITAVVSVVVGQQSIVFYQAHTGWIDEIVYDAPGGGKSRHLAFGYFPSERELNAGLDWLMKQAQPGEVVAASVPAWAYLRTRLEAVMPPFEARPEKAQLLLDSVPVAYLFLEKDNFNINGESTSHYVSPVIQHHPDLWARIYSAPSGQLEIYRRTGLAVR